MGSGKERFEILLEEIRGDVKLALEGHQVIRSEMHQMELRLNEKIEENSSAIKWVAKDVREIKEKVDKIDSKLEEHIRLPAHA